MTKRCSSVATVVSLLTALLVAGLVAVGFAIASLTGLELTSRATCNRSMEADEAKVRTDRWEPADDIPGLGEYVEIHWQLRAAGDPCSRGPGPTDWQYQGIIHLRPNDAQALAARYDWQPLAPSPSPGVDDLDTPAQVWPSLEPFVPAGARSLHNDSYDEQRPQVHWRRVYLDQDRAVAFFALYDH
jgi:hypothetical protein